MNVLLIGSGGREHTLAWKIVQSPLCSRLFVAPGNAGTREIAVNVPVSVEDFNGLTHLIKKESIELVIVGPEAPLVLGFADRLKADPDLGALRVIGPGMEGAQLEGSKDFSKAFMERHGVPTARHRTFTAQQVEEGKRYLDTLTPPFVLKADGLAAGKGVIISSDLDEAKQSLTDMLLGEKFGEASRKVLIEEYLEGIELSVFVLTDGKDYVILPEAKDYKRIGDGDTGPNTGGMGAVSPVPFATDDFLQKVEDRIIKPTINGLIKDGIDYKGFIFIGLMNRDGAPFVIEYNVRMGDPETQAVIPRVKNDLMGLFLAVTDGNLKSVSLDISDQTAVTVVGVAGGYPEEYRKGDEISGLKNIPDIHFFHAGTKYEDNKILTNGGRVLAVTSLKEDLKSAISASYEGLRETNWKDCYYRKDIGRDLMNYNN